MTNEQLVKKFQCPGCVCGENTSCRSYKWSEQSKKCEGHMLGTMLNFAGSIALGLPKGFCRPG
jgi:hypothetical protein